MAERLIPSPLESHRFSLSVARATMSGESKSDATDLLSDFLSSNIDLVILRYPTSLVAGFEVFAREPRVLAIHADTLLHFDWVDRGERLEPAHRVVGRASIDSNDVAQLVVTTFARYPNHYAANAALDRDAVAVGYAEWAERLFAADTNLTFGVLDDATLVGLAVIDTSKGWDVALAGVQPQSRSKGFYGSLMTGVMSAARAAGESGVHISTQSHNVQVMRTWERLGWRITSSWSTVHLMKRR